MLYPLRASTVTVSGQDTIPLSTLPKAWLGRIPHVRRFIFELTYTPTTTALPNNYGNNAVVKQCDFNDGTMFRFQGGFNHLRAFERISGSHSRVPDAQTGTASGTARYVTRVMYFGPPNAVGADSDFLIPTGMLENGEIRLTYGALTDVASDCTAFTGQLKIWADIVLLDEIRIPPAVQQINYTTGAADYQIPGRALFLSLFQLNSSTFDAISAGDFGNYTVDLGQGPIVQAIPSYALTRAYWDDMGVSNANTFQGEPRGASDNNARVVDPASSTALATATSDLQPILWMKNGGKLTKAPLADSSARLMWDGTQGTSVLLVQRVLAQSSNVVGAMAKAALNAIGKQPGATKIKTYSKEDYKGPLVEFMPYRISVA